MPGAGADLRGAGRDEQAVGGRVIRQVQHVQLRATAAGRAMTLSARASGSMTTSSPRLVPRTPRPSGRRMAARLVRSRVSAKAGLDQARWRLIGGAGPGDHGIDRTDVDHAADRRRHRDREGGLTLPGHCCGADVGGQGRHGHGHLGRGPEVRPAGGRRFGRGGRGGPAGRGRGRCRSRRGPARVRRAGGKEDHHGCARRGHG